jgi:hypothetical protein
MKSSTTLPIQILARAKTEPKTDWFPLDEGPGYFDLDPTLEICLYLPRAEDETAETLAEEWIDCPLITKVDVSEGRRMSDQGLKALGRMHQVSELNVSACSISNQGIDFLFDMPNLQRLDISHCTGIGDLGLRRIEEIRTLTFLNLRGCPRVTRNGLKRLEKHCLNLEVFR